MTDEQLKYLAEADEPMARMCFHGIMIKHDCPAETGGGVHREGHPLFTLRFVGHLLSDYNPCIDPASSDVVPDHNLFSVDLPMHPPTLGNVSETIAEAAAQAFVCDFMTHMGDAEVIPLFPGEEMPEILKSMPNEIKDQLPPFLREILFGDEGQSGKGN